jgi:hypothetical protein
VDPACTVRETRFSRVFHHRSRQLASKTGGLAIALTGDMETLIDPFELHAPGSDPIPAPRMRPRMQSIVIDVEWDDPPPAPSSRGVRVWETE